jgi:hypothetical protein
MTPEEKFLFYREHANETARRLSVINTMATYLHSVRVDVPDCIAERLEDCVSYNSRGEEAEVLYIVRKLVKSGPLRLFESTTLMLLSEVGFCEYPSSNGEVSCRNIEHRIGEMVRKSNQYSDVFSSQMVDEIADTRVLSFAGFYRSEIDIMISSVESRANRLLETLRDINTTMKYMRIEHMWPNGKLVKRVPACPPEDLYGQYEWLEPLVLSEWWLTTVTGDAVVAGHVKRAFDDIFKLSAPRPGEPATLDYFGSHVTNKVKIELPA